MNSIQASFCQCNEVPTGSVPHVTARIAHRAMLFEDPQVKDRIFELWLFVQSCGLVTG